MDTNICIDAQYDPTAVYFSDADYVEYVTQDVPCVQNRVDEYLTLSRDMYTQELIGFRFKGFRNFYLRYLSETQSVFEDDEFLSFVTIIEKAVEVVGHDVFETDERRSQGYRAARTLAQEHNARLNKAELAA